MTTARGERNVEKQVEGVEVTILWNGGWDDLLVDPTQVHDLSEAELAINEHAAKSGCLHPFTGPHGDWLLVRFTRNRFGNLGLDPNRQAIRILRRIASGD